MMNNYSSPEAELILVESEQLIAISSGNGVTAPALTEDEPVIY